MRNQSTPKPVKQTRFDAALVKNFVVDEAKYYVNCFMLVKIGYEKSLQLQNCVH